MFMFFHALVFLAMGLFGSYDGGPGYLHASGFGNAQSLAPDSGGTVPPTDGGGSMPGEGGGGGR
ncbi:MAG TPA: hypothetical protein VGI19_09795 [Candidatus Cybelea sp.]|jgi:hypothetical protein